MEHSGVDIYFVLFENLKRVRHSYKLHAHKSFSMNYVVIKLIKTPVKVLTFLKKNVNLKSKKKNFFGRSNPYNKPFTNNPRNKTIVEKNQKIRDDLWKSCTL